MLLYALCFSFFFSMYRRRPRSTRTDALVPYTTLFRSTLNIVTLILLIIGGLNWGLVGLFEFNLVAAIFGEMSLLSQIIYILVGLSALWQIIALARGNHAERRV